MKKTLLASVLIGLSFGATASPYVGIEYGFGSGDSNTLDGFSKFPEIKLKPSLEDGIWRGFVGYTLTPSLALELGYSQFNMDDDHSQLISFNQTYKEERDWSAKLKAKQIFLTPVYNYDINDKWQAKFKAGLSYTWYNTDKSQSREREIHFTETEVSVPEEYNSNSTSRIGAIMSAGIDYKINHQLVVGANIKYQFDSLVNITSCNLGATYHF